MKKIFSNKGPVAGFLARRSVRLSVRRSTLRSTCRSVFLFACLCGCLPAAAQKADSYILPMKIPVYLSGNVGELRGGHFHSGIDFKTQGVTGKPVYSVASGYVSRVAVSPWGYGRALYVTHPDGTTSVYAHLDRFSPQIEEYVKDNQYRMKSYAVDLFPAKVKFPVAQGEQIAYSGNSGSSGGPHLHFEIRDAAQQPLNLPALGIMNFTDTISPRIATLYYVSVDTVRGIPVHRTRHTIPIKGTAGERYTLAGPEPLEVSPAGYFAAEVSERKNGTSNTFGIYSTELRLDGEVVFGFALDRVNFSTTRYSQAVALHPESRGKRNYVYRFAKLPNNPLPVYKNIRNNGMIILGDDSLHKVEIDVTDDSGNSTTLFFAVRKGKGPEPEPADSVGIPVRWNAPFTHSQEGASVSIPAGTLYESVLFDFSVGPKGEGMYSPVYAVHDPDVPLQGYIEISMDAGSLPENLRSKALAGVIANGRRSSAGGGYKDGRVTVRTRSFGSYYIAVDDTPPRITPSFTDGGDLTGHKSVSFVISDDFSGVDKYSALIDGQWELFEYEPSKNRITHCFGAPPTGSEHNIELTVTDTKGNVRTYKGTFIR